MTVCPISVAVKFINKSYPKPIFSVLLLIYSLLYLAYYKKKLMYYVTSRRRLPCSSMMKIIFK